MKKCKEPLCVPAKKQILVHCSRPFADRPTREPVAVATQSIDVRYVVIHLALKNRTHNNINLTIDTSAPLLSKGRWHFRASRRRGWFRAQKCKDIEDAKAQKEGELDMDRGIELNSHAISATVIGPTQITRFRIWHAR